MKCFVPKCASYLSEARGYVILGRNTMEASANFTGYIDPAASKLIEVVELPRRLLSTLQVDGFAELEMPNKLHVYVVTGYGPWLIETCLNILDGIYDPFSQARHIDTNVDTVAR